MDLDSLERGIIYKVRELKKSGHGRLEVVVIENRIHRVIPQPAFDMDAISKYVEKVEAAGTLTQ